VWSDGTGAIAALIWSQLLDQVMAPRIIGVSIDSCRIDI